MARFNKHQLETTDQELFTDSFNFCCELLKKKEYYLSERETNIFSKLSFNYGHDMYKAVKIIMNKIIKSNEHKSKVELIKIVTAKATCDSGYDDNCDKLDQQQKQQQVDKVNIDIDNSQDKMISKKRKISVDEIHSRKTLKADYKKNSSDDSSNDLNIQIACDENSITQLHMIDSIEKEEELFINESITIKDEMLSMTDDSIDVDKMNNSIEHLIGLGIRSNGISNSFNDNNQSCSIKVIENVDHQKNTRIRTGSLVPKKYSFCTENDDEPRSTSDKNDLNNNDIDVDDDDDDDNSLNQNENLEDKIKVYDAISFEEKTRVVKLASKNPNWSLDWLRERSGCEGIRQRSQVELWKKQIQQGGSSREKINYVNNWVINKCIDKQKKGEIITNKKIKTLGLEAKKNI